jgi:hypothetical protein
MISLACKRSRCGLACLIALAAVMALSCDENKQPQPDSDAAPTLATPAQAPVPQPAVAKASTAPPRPNAAAANADIVAPPKDARYTVFCTTISGSNHTAEAIRLRDQAIAVTHWRDWYVINQEDESQVYFGYYRSIDDPKDPAEGKRAHAAVLAVAGLSNRLGDHPFSRAILVPLDAPDPDAPPEWNLANSRMYWSVEIASYTGSPDRKKAAVDAVRAARAMGIEAYFYHGQSISSVCIGAWPVDAIQRQQQAAISANRGNPDQTLLYVPSEVADKVPGGLVDQQGRPVKVVTEKVDVRDPAITQTLQSYPHHAVNGEEFKQVVNGQDIFQPSFIVAIPHHAPSVLDSDATLPLSPPPDPNATPAAPAGTQNGHLRSLDSGK